MRATIRCPLAVTRRIPGALAALLALAACAGSGSPGNPDAVSPDAVAGCGTVSAPSLLTVADVQPAAGASVPAIGVVHRFTVKDAPGLFAQLTFGFDAGHTAGMFTPAQFHFRVDAQGADLVYVADPVDWPDAPAHVAMKVVQTFQTKDGCVWALPDPLFSYDVVPGAAPDAIEATEPGPDAAEVPANAAEAADLVPDTAPDSAPDAAPDVVAGDPASEADAVDPDATAEEAEPKPLPPVVPGPPANLFDCTADPAKLPGHLSPAPIGCIWDLSCHEPLVIGHRAAGGEFGTIAPENSLSAIRAAIVMGLDAVELDARDTSDGRFVIMHDPDVSRTTDGTGTVGNLTLAQIQAFHMKTDKLLSGGDFSCDRVPTLDEAMDLAKDRLWIYLDTKTDKLAELVALIRDHGMLDQVVICSGSIDKELAARQADPKARTLVWLDSMDLFRQATSTVDPPIDVYEALITFATDAIPYVHGLGRKISLDAFNFDMTYYADDDPHEYLDRYDQGFDVMQVEFPPQILKVLGRWKF